jgi:putative ABC transport system ATP-binding protein
MTADKEIVLSVRNLTKAYSAAGERIAVLRGVNLEIAAGERVALTGESGSGKSTLLHLVAGLDRADGGEIDVAGASVSQLNEAGLAAMRRDRLGLVFQQFNLIPSLSVRDNLAFQSRIAGRHDGAWQNELAERLGLAGLLDRYPEQLSGGQQQRVAIARALINSPQIVFADEPTGNLDSKTSKEILQMFQNLSEEDGITVVLVTHDPGVAHYARRVVRISDGLIAEGVYDAQTAELDPAAA